MTMPARLKAHLDQTHVSYEPVFHIPTYSAQSIASALHVPGKEVAKTVVVQAGGGIRCWRFFRRPTASI